MSRLEEFALEKESEKDLLKRHAGMIFTNGEMNESILEKVIEKAYRLGHHAGHCRGEDYKNKIMKGAI